MNDRLSRALELLRNLEYDEYGIPETFPSQIEVIELLEDE